LQLLLRGNHLLGGLRQQLGDLLERRIRYDETRVHALDETVHLILQFALRQRQHDHAFTELLRRHALAIALDVERAGNDLALLLRQGADFLARAAATATAAARHRRRRLEVLVERTNAQEIDVARRALRAVDRIVVGRLRVIRNGVAGLHADLLHIERVTGGHFAGRPRAAKQRNRFFRAAVDRVDELQVLDRVVVVGLRFNEEFFDRRRVGVASGFRQLDGRREIGEQINGVLRRCGEALAFRRIELDAIEAVMLRGEIR
jgi:hypothetical protein